METRWSFSSRSRDSLRSPVATNRDCPRKFVPMKDWLHPLATREVAVEDPRGPNNIIIAVALILESAFVFALDPLPTQTSW